MSVIDGDKRVKVVAALVNRDGPGCFYCKRQFDDEGNLNSQRTIDHWIPRSRGGTRKVDNLRLACFSCNHMKDAMTGPEFLVSEKFLARQRQIANFANREWRVFLDAHGLRIDGSGFWHPAFTWEQERATCGSCGLTVTVLDDFRKVPCSKVADVLY